MRRKFFLAIAAAMVLAGISTSASASGHAAMIARNHQRSQAGHSPQTTTTNHHRAFPVPSARRASTLDWCDAHFGGCWRDPSSGGLNTVIQDSLQSNSNAEDWSLQSNNGPCSGTVTATCPGGWLSANARGFSFVTLRNIGQGTLCFGANAQNFWTGKMATCDGVNNTHHWDTVFVYDPQASCGSTTLPGFLSYQWQRNGNSNGAWITDENGLNQPVMVQFAPNIAHCNEALWGPTAS